MSFKAIVFCASAFLVQSISGQCLSVTPSCGCGSIQVPSNGGPLVATSIGPIRPSGIALATDLSLAGNLAVNGALPFLSAVAFDGQFPNSGTASVSYGCGDGNVYITQEQGNPGGSNAASASGLSIDSLGLGSCGCKRY